MPGIDLLLRTANEDAVSRAAKLRGIAAQKYRSGQPGSKEAAYEIFERVAKRLEERVALVKTLTSSTFTFTTNEKIVLDRHELAWPATSAEAQELWRLRIKHEALLEQTPDLGLAAARYYLNPATSSRGGRCWFEKNLIPVVAIGDHHFYREPTSEERAAGWRPSTPPWCAMVHKYKKFRSRHAAHPLRRRA